ncbi:integration host factor subunit beta [Sphingomonas sp. CFBP 8760]|nr:HU family DNA-binding protein [Sphingomonas sp. CFBP 8760]MBD8548276.1 integration host factor subunit beta [Sphingomonas sp. CFBP 8760]
MTRSELVERLAEKHPDLAAAHVEALVNAFFDVICRKLVNGGRVELRGFGAFQTRLCPAGSARNPRTGEKITLKRRRVPVFRPGRDIGRRINGQGAGPIGFPFEDDVE